MFKNKKGNYQYLKKEPIRVGIITILLFLMAAGVWYIGYAMTKDIKNILTVVSMLGMLPACRSLVNMIMLFKAEKHSCKPEDFLEIEKAIGDHEIIHGYDLSAESINNIDDFLKQGENRFTSHISELDYDYDLVILCNVMHHVPVQERDNILLKIYERLSKYGVLSKEERTIDKKLTSKDGKYIIPVSKIYNGTVVLSQPTIEDKDDKYYYGNFIDYDVDIDGTTTDYDWKIFYTDETNIYII